MGTAHLSSEELSALLDGELSGQTELRARTHLGECPSCSAEFALSLRLDGELRQPPVLSCDAVLEVLSASLDREAGEGEQAAGQRHLASCEACQASVQKWTAVTAAITALPIVAPHARVDRAIRELAEPSGDRRRMPVTGVAARALITLTAVFAILVGGLGIPVRAPATPATSDRVLVAAMQQIVFNPNNNTFYVLDAPGAAVDAREAESNALVTRIVVGGEPTALALNEDANTILVLDAAMKRVTEIDAASNTVIGATTVAVAGTPTSISVDPAGKILVTTVAGPESAAQKSPSGAVAVIDSATKQLETVREIDVAPRVAVPDPERGRTALVSADATTIVDSSYRIIDTLPGGVGAAFSRRGDTLAVLSAAGADSLVLFTSPNAPLNPVTLKGAPRAITALADGGYLVLTESGGLGYVTKIARDGVVAGTTEIAVGAGDLLQDENTNRFIVANAGRLFTGQIPGQVARGSSTPTQSSSASASPSESASASPSASPSESPAASAAPAAAVNVFANAKPTGPSLYTLPLPDGIKPELATTSGSRIWFLDQANGVNSFDMGTGELQKIGKLRNGAQVDLWVASPSYVFGVDATNGEVSVVNIAKQRIDAYATNVLSPVSSVAAGFDDRLWIALRDAPYLLVFDAKTRQMNSIDLAGARISALTIDPQGRILYADDFRGTVGSLDPKTSRLNEVGFAKRGATTALLVDNTSTLWLGTSTGEVYSVRGGAARIAVSLQRPVTALVTDHTGRAWYLAQLPGGLSGYSYAPADGKDAPRSVSGPAVSLSFNPLGRAFLADPRGAIAMSLEGAR